MSDQAFRAAIIERPDDPIPRLVYADWLAEHGRPIEEGVQREWAAYLPKAHATRNEVHAIVAAFVGFGASYRNGLKRGGRTMLDNGVYPVQDGNAMPRLRPYTTRRTIVRPRIVGVRLEWEYAKITQGTYTRIRRTIGAGVELATHVMTDTEWVKYREMVVLESQRRSTLLSSANVPGITQAVSAFPERVQVKYFATGSDPDRQRWKLNVLIWDLLDNMRLTQEEYDNKYDNRNRSESEIVVNRPSPIYLGG